MKITPFDEAGSYRTGGLIHVTAADIEKKLGFPSNIEDDSSKVKYSWGFKVNGVPCGIWDYKGSWMVGSFSTFGPNEIFVKLFDKKYVA